MATVHDEIDNWLAADIYGELSDEEQRQLHTHLVECAACRKTHQETKTMNKMLEETLATQNPIQLSNNECWLVFASESPKEAVS